MNNVHKTGILPTLKSVLSSFDIALIFVLFLIYIYNLSVLCMLLKKEANLLCFFDFYQFYIYIYK